MWGYGQPAGGQPTCCCQRLQEKDSIGVDESQQGESRTCGCHRIHPECSKLHGRDPKFGLVPKVLADREGRPSKQLSTNSAHQAAVWAGRRTEAMMRSCLASAACSKPDALEWGSKVTGRSLHDLQKHSCRKQISIHTWPEGAGRSLA